MIRRVINGEVKEEGCVQVRGGITSKLVKESRQMVLTSVEVARRAYANTKYTCHYVSSACLRYNSDYY